MAGATAEVPPLGSRSARRMAPLVPRWVRPFSVVRYPWWGDPPPPPMNDPAREARSLSARSPISSTSPSLAGATGRSRTTETSTLRSTPARGRSWTSPATRTNTTGRTFQSCRTRRNTRRALSSLTSSRRKRISSFGEARQSRRSRCQTRRNTRRPSDGSRGRRREISQGQEIGAGAHPSLPSDQNFPRVLRDPCGSKCVQRRSREIHGA